MFKTATKAQYVGLLIYIVTGYFFALATFIMDIIESTRTANKTIKVFVRMFPQYCMARAMLNLSIANLPFIDLWTGKEDPLDMKITGTLICAMGWESVLYFLLNLMIEYLSTIPSVNALLGIVADLPK